ncbi:MAG TPA: trigger factor [Thermoanaerobaculales bacterium]|nr:trigger factor [Thermoanaerobaculales bacterium]HPA82299.1 trigger factor [Thermoanaerobaculales bacterium]HQL28822.1 trigger factor [Thermoanaerobaculales bacterium]HQP42249.1 trigger factor [Thermoanaerobaculales bacterium]
MPYTLNRRANNTVEVTAELDAETVASERAGIIRSFRRKASVPGFRPGKAPDSAIRARFGDDIEQELKEQLAGKLLEEVFDGEEGLEPITRPEVSDAAFDDGGGFRIKAEMELRPRFQLPSLEGFQLPEVSLEVGDAELATELDSVAEENATWEPADAEVAADGMLVEADLHGLMEGSDQGPYDEKGARFVIGHGSVPQQINEALQGVRVGEQRVAERRFPDDDPDTARAGKTVRYTIDVTALKRKVRPAVDDELARTLGYDSIDGLKERVAEVLRSNKLRQRREQWRRALLDHLEAAIDANELPPSLVSSAVREDLSRFAYTMAMQGVEPAAAGVNWQEMAARMEPGSRRRVLDMLVLEQLADDWQIAVPEADVDAYVSLEARQRGIPAGEHKANLAKEHKLEELRGSARISATVDEMIRRVGGEVE